MFGIHARSASLVRALTVAALFSLSSCIFVADGYRDAEGNWHSTDGAVEVRVDRASADSESDGKDGAKGATAKTDDAKADEAADKAHELMLAQLDLEIARLSVDVQRTETANGLARAGRELADAQKALEQFKTVEMPLRVKDGAFDIERSKFSIEIKKIELEELIAMYKNDEFAASTKEIVVKRETKELEFMQRGLAMEEEKFATLTGFELPHELAEKEDAARKAEEAFKKAEVEAKKTELEIKKSLSEAERKIAKLEKEAAKK
ncbi:MAG: hypothetical protein IT453_21050 [Planctomycetes bacterium]|nr:hypothetical protein [Planctomycetota bacterium]